MKTPNFSTAQQAEFLLALGKKYPKSNLLTTKQILDVSEELGTKIPYFILHNDAAKIGRGKYDLSKLDNHKPVVAAVTAPVVAMQSAPQMLAQVIPMTKRAANVTESYVPEKIASYVPFGFFSDLRKIIKSGVFYPVYITGLSGNGKTMMVEQVCASLSRELIRVNITKRTDEETLIGSYELIDGNTVRREGPVITAMRRGAVLLLDETDYGTEDLLCLQPILEGKQYFDKKTGEVIHPAKGFTVIATANTKGKGSDDGRFMGANTLNEAFLERFAITVEQEYPTATTEREILAKSFAENGVSDDDFVDKLVRWAFVVRRGYDEQIISEVISTRRLTHIAKAFSIFGDRKTALQLCLNRFDDVSKTALYDMYTKVDGEMPSANEEVVAPAPTVEVSPF